MTRQEAFEKWFPYYFGYDIPRIEIAEVRIARAIWQASRAALLAEIKASGAYETQGGIICYRLPKGEG